MDLKCIASEIQKVNKNTKPKDRTIKKERINTELENTLMRLDKKTFSLSNVVVFGSQPYATINEAKLLRILISQFNGPKNKKDEEKFTYTYSAKVTDLCKKMGIYNPNSRHTMYETVKKAVLGLQSRVLFISDGEKWRSINWTSQCSYQSGVISITLNELIIPYIHNLKGNFTVLSVDEITKFKNKYALRLYEILYARIHQDSRKRTLSYEYKETEIEFDLDEFKIELSVYGMYSDVSDLKKRCIKPAVDEINHLTNITITEFKLIAKNCRAKDCLSFSLKLKKHLIVKSNDDEKKEVEFESKFNDLIASWNKMALITDEIEEYIFVERESFDKYCVLLKNGIRIEEIENAVWKAANAEFFKSKLGGTFNNFLKLQYFRKINNGDYNKIRNHSGKNNDINVLSYEDKLLYEEKAVDDEAWFDMIEIE